MGILDIPRTLSSGYFGSCTSTEHPGKSQGLWNHSKRWQAQPSPVQGMSVVEVIIIVSGWSFSLACGGGGETCRLNGVLESKNNVCVAKPTFAPPQYVLVCYIVHHGHHTSFENVKTIDISIIKYKIIYPDGRQCPTWYIQKSFEGSTNDMHRLLFPRYC